MKTLLLGFIFIFWAASISLAVDTQTTLQTVFFQANTFYTQGQYKPAAEAYETVLQAGFASGNVYFNLGNAYFRNGQAGKAILNYERARRFLPSDPDLAANLQFARSLAGAVGCQLPLWKRLVFPLAHTLATDSFVWFTSIAYTLLFVILAVYYLSPLRPQWLLYAGRGFVVLLLVMMTSLIQQARTDDLQRKAVVLAKEDSPVRFEPADNGTVHFSVTQGTLIQILDVREDWWQVARCDGRRGWIERDVLEEL